MAHSGVWPNGTQYRGEIFYVACNHFPKIGNTCMYELQVQRKVPYDGGTRVRTQSQRVGPRRRRGVVVATRAHIPTVVGSLCLQISLISAP